MKIFQPSVTLAFVDEQGNPVHFPVRVNGWIHRCTECGQLFMSKRSHTYTCTDRCRARRQRRCVGELCK